MQNASATPAYVKQIEAGQLAGARGHEMSEEDQMRARAIEMIMCDFALDRTALEQQFGPLTAGLEPDLAKVAERFGTLVSLDDHKLEISPDGRPMTRIIASLFDAHMPADAKFSRAS